MLTSPTRPGTAASDYSLPASPGYVTPPPPPPRTAAAAAAPAAPAAVVRTVDPHSDSAKVVLVSAQTVAASSNSSNGNSAADVSVMLSQVGSTGNERVGLSVEPVHDVSDTEEAFTDVSDGHSVESAAVAVALAAPQVAGVRDS